MPYLACVPDPFSISHKFYTNTFTRKTRSKKAVFIWVSQDELIQAFGRSERPRDIGQLRLASMPLYIHTCSWTTVTSESFPSSSLALHACQAVSFMIINTSRQYHMTRGPTWSLTWIIRHYHMQTEVLFSNKSHHVDEGESLSIIYIKKKKHGEGFDIGHSYHRQVWQHEPSFHHILYMWVLKRFLLISCSHDPAVLICKFLLIKQNLLEINWKLVCFYFTWWQVVKKKKKTLIVNKCIQKRKKRLSADCPTPRSGNVDSFFCFIITTMFSSVLLRL